MAKPSKFTGSRSKSTAWKPVPVPGQRKKGASGSFAVPAPGKGRYTVVAKPGSGTEQTGSNFGQRKGLPTRSVPGSRPVVRAQIKSAGPRKSPGGLVMRGGIAYSTKTGKPIQQAPSQALGNPGLDFAGIGNAVKNFMGNVVPQDMLPKVIGKRIKQATGGKR